MNKQEIIKEIAKNVGISKTQATQAIESFIDSITQTLKKGEDVKFVNFGTFHSVKRNPRVGRNPRNGAEIQIPAKSVVRFKPGTALRNKLNS